ncbi:MAG: TRAM domain-containing protein, partial [Acidimicrobiales bacterium]|nr:TRAM domain-containing protein [Acidimicrobiales bacterium]
MLRLTIDGLSNGGEGVARDGDGRVVFVEGALPGEVVEAEVVEQRPRFARARLATIERASDARVDPGCATLEAGCGGCDLRHLDPAHQPEAKARIVRDVLERLAGFSDIEVVAG